MSRLLQQAIDLLREYCASRGDDDFVASVEEEIAALRRMLRSNQSRRKWMFRKIEGMTWPAPSDALDDVQWRLRFSSPSKSDLLVAAGVMAAYNQMVADPKSKRDMIVRELRKGPNLTPNVKLNARAVRPVAVEAPVGRGKD